MSQQSELPEAVKKLIGVESPPVVLEVEKGTIYKFVEAIDDPNPLWKEEAPPTFLSAVLGISEPGRSPIKVDIPHTGNLNGGYEWEYFQPVRAGDVITARSKVANAYTRSGRLGPTLFVIFEITYQNQREQLVAKVRNTLMWY